MQQLAGMEESSKDMQACENGVDDLPIIEWPRISSKEGSLEEQREW